MYMPKYNYGFTYQFLVLLKHQTFQANLSSYKLHLHLDEIVLTMSTCISIHRKPKFYVPIADGLSTFTVWGQARPVSFHRKNLGCVIN